MVNKVVRSGLVLIGLFPIWLHGQGMSVAGKDLYELKCGRCHFAYSAQKYSLEEWKTIMTDMGPNAGLTAEDEAKILEYLEEFSSGGEGGGLPSSPVLSGYIYTEFFAGSSITDTFDIHYLNVGLTGRLHERVSYHTEFEFEHGAGEAEPPFIEQAYMDVRMNRNAALRIGAILTPFNRFDEMHGPLENLLVTRPQMSREIGVSAWKEVGLDLHGHLPIDPKFYLNYDVYAINGLGAGRRLRNSRHYEDNNDAKSIGARVSGVFADRWELGVSYYRGAWDDDGELNLDMYGVHFMGRVADLDLYAEYSKAVSENPAPLEDGEADGFFVQASYLIDGRFRPTVRYGSLDYLDEGNLLGRSPTNRDQRVLALGFNYYLTRAVVFKVEYDFYQEGDRVAEADNDLLAFQAAVRF